MSSIGTGYNLSVTNLCSHGCVFQIEYAAKAVDNSGTVAGIKCKDGIVMMKTIAKISGDVYNPRGVSVPALDKDCLWEFQPNKFGEGDTITGGDLYVVILLAFSLVCSWQGNTLNNFFLKVNHNFGMQTVLENTLMTHHVALPPDAMGKITYIAPAGRYSLKDTVLELEFQGVKKIIHHASELACTYALASSI